MHAVWGGMTGTAFHLAAAGTETLAESGGCVLHAVVVNTAGASGASVTLHDGSDVSGPVVAVIDATAVRGIVFDVLLAAGLTVVVAGTPDVTVVVQPGS